jgi:hypothetical protein
MRVYSSWRFTRSASLLRTTILLCLGVFLLSWPAGGSEVSTVLTAAEAVRGQTNQQIARTLSISVSTVKRHVRHISEKLGVSERVQVAVRAVELGVLDDREGD